MTPDNRALQTFLVERRLRRSVTGPLVEVVGGAESAASEELRDFLIECNVRHVWLDAGQLLGEALMRSAWLELDDLPAVFAYGRCYRKVTPRALAMVLQLGSDQPDERS